MAFAHQQGLFARVCRLGQHGVVETDLEVLATAGRLAFEQRADHAERRKQTAAEVADAWVAQDDHHERYFFENVRHGIRTTDDGSIWKRIEERAPTWLGAEEYRESVKLLRSEAQQLA